MKKALIIAALSLLAIPALALDLGDLQKKADDVSKDPNVKAAAAVAGPAVTNYAGDKGAEILTEKLKNIQNEKGPIVFKSGGAVLDAAKCEQTLKSIDGLVKQFPGMLVTVEGHTDNKGSKKKNLTLSQKRADAVIAWLKGHLQTPADQLAAKGYGDSKPIADNKTEAGRAKNRRVDFSVSKIK